MRRSNLMTQNTARYQSSINNWLVTCLFRSPKFEMSVQDPITLSHGNQGTRFKGFPTYPNDMRPIETGDHLFSYYKHFAFHNMMMRALYVLFIDPTNTPVAEKQKNGRNDTETTEQYIKRASEETPKNWAKVITDDTNCFAIEEGVVEAEHLPLFKKGIEKYLPGWELRGGTTFGLWFLVRKEYAEKYVIDNNLSSALKKLKLDSRCLTLVGPTEKVSNIHVPHSDPEINYKNIVRIILEDMVNQVNPKNSERITLDIAHIVSDQEHLKDGGTRRVSVSGITEFTLHCGDKIISHKILGDFNLALSKRQKLDQAAFSEIKEKFTVEWAFKTIAKNAKYIAGLFIGGMTLTTDFAAMDETIAVGITALRSTIPIWEKAIMNNAAFFSNSLVATHARMIDREYLEIHERPAESRSPRFHQR